MIDFIDWINGNQGFIRTLLTCVYLVATLAMVLASVRSVRISGETLAEMKAAQDEEMRPDVLFDVRFAGHDMDFVLENVGRTAARNLNLSLEPDALIRSGWTSQTRGPEDPYRIHDLAIVAHPVEMLGPGECFGEHVDVSFRFFNNNPDRHLRGRLTYEDESGKPYAFEIDLDLSPYADRGFVVEDDLDQLIQILERLKRHFTFKRT